MEALLQVRDLHVHYNLSSAGPVCALQGVDFVIREGESVGVLGESGCGKSTLAATIMGLLPSEASVSRGSVRLRGRELVGLNEKELRCIRGTDLELIYQEPALALNPVLRVGQQVADVVRAHMALDRARAIQRAQDMLACVGLEGERYFRAYPHQLSGGQLQRVVIAQALVCRPALVTADEPTSSLDSTTQAEILGLLQRLRQEMGVSLLLISHDPAVLATLCDRVLVIYAGKIVEQGILPEVYCHPRHPYTKALLSLMAGRQGENSAGVLPAIPGQPPSLSLLPSGCSFEPRCSERLEACAARAPEEVAEGERRVRCFKYGG
ncbi:MAG: ABC transporter ATP-binding protein [Acidobacteriia bacterium]|nr:ABC transporter ATP-binding protein [Terriglobia bacterium]